MGVENSNWEGEKRMKPISPREAESVRSESIPDKVVEIFNRHIVKNVIAGVSIVLQEDVVRDICEEMEIPRNRVFELRYLDVETLFKSVGWIVEYDKPGYNENYKPSFTFKSPHKG